MAPSQNQPLKCEGIGTQPLVEELLNPLPGGDIDTHGFGILDQLRFPERGSYPKELVALGIKEYRQASFKPYRVIYRVTGSQVIIYLIADGRRDMQSVLARRLLGA